jgi:hypothetical protein
MQKISRLAEQVLASQEGFHCILLVVLRVANEVSEECDFAVIRIEFYR